ncbi:MAG: hypothetical protein ACK4N5_18090, partial [Myxococcales bacterium]
ASSYSRGQGSHRCIVTMREKPRVTVTEYEAIARHVAEAMVAVDLRLPSGAIQQVVAAPGRVVRTEVTHGRKFSSRAEATGFDFGRVVDVEALRGKLFEYVTTHAAQARWQLQAMRAAGTVPLDGLAALPPEEALHRLMIYAAIVEVGTPSPAALLGSRFGFDTATASALVGRAPLPRAR